MGQHSASFSMSSHDAVKVAIFLDDFSATGVVTNAIAIAGGLSAAGHQVHLLATIANGPLLASVPSSVQVTALLEHGGTSRHWRMRKSLLGYRRFLRRQKPDVIFSAGNQGHLTTMLAARSLPSCRTAIRISNDPVRQGGDRKRGWVNRTMQEAKFRFITTRADRLIVVSRHLLHVPGLCSPAIDAKTIVIPNGVDLDAIGSRASGICACRWLEDGGDPVVLAVGRLVEQKNFGTLIDALAIARKSRPMRLLIIGQGPQREKLLARAAKRRVARAVTINPPVPDAVPCIAKAAVLAVPSWREGSSNVLLEAVACGTPIVASETAGSASEVLGEGRFGMLVQPDDADAMAQALLTQTGSKPVRPGQRARDYSRAAAIDQYVDVLTQLARAQA
jgi:glycosyltransferase involved in cell wall biosynthesis